MTAATSNPIMQVIHRAMKDPDSWIVDIVYKDSSGIRSKRAVSPIKYVGADMVALCLCRQEPRRFRMSQIQSATLRSSADAMMPEQIILL